MPWSRLTPSNTSSTTRNVYAPGISGQTVAGRQLTVADFTSMGLSQPVGLFNLSSTTNLGTGGNLTNKGSVAFTGTGVEGVANTAAVLTGSTAQTLYVSDTGASDPYRIRYGSWGCWFRTGKGSNQPLLYKYSAAARSFGLTIGNTYGVAGAVQADLNFSSGNGVDLAIYASTAGLHDNLWHFAVATWDGSAFCLYIDGKLDAYRQANNTSQARALQSAANPVNIGSWQGDASTTAGETFTGLLEEAFITADVLSEDQVRLLYCAKFAHNLPSIPKHTSVAVRRYRAGATLTTGDFSTTPLRLYNFTNGALTDEGSNATALTNNNSAVATAGVDGLSSNAFQLVSASSQYLSSTDTGLPSGTANSTMGCWFRTNSAGLVNHLLTYGTSGNRRTIYITNGAQLAVVDGGSQTLLATAVLDVPMWHFCAYVAENSATDGFRQKLYLDGKLVATNTNTITSTTLAGANSFKIGGHPSLAGEYLNGSIDSVFITNYAMQPDELYKIYAKGSQSLGVSPKNAGDHIEKVDSSHVYIIADDLGPQHQIDIELRT